MMGQSIGIYQAKQVREASNLCNIDVFDLTYAHKNVLTNDESHSLSFCWCILTRLRHYIPNLSQKNLIEFLVIKRL